MNAKEMLKKLNYELVEETELIIKYENNKEYKELFFDKIFCTYSNSFKRDGTSTIIRSGLHLAITEQLKELSEKILGDEYNENI